MAGPNWARLYKQGRCKAVGVPWNEEEALAVGPLGIPANYVRSGVLTVEDYEKALEQDEKKGLPVERMETQALVEKAKDLGLDVPANLPDSELRFQIVNEESKTSAKVKKATKKAEKAVKSVKKSVAKNKKKK